MSFTPCKNFKLWFKRNTEHWSIDWTYFLGWLCLWFWFILTHKKNKTLFRVMGLFNHPFLFENDKFGLSSYLFCQSEVLGFPWSLFLFLNHCKLSLFCLMYHFFLKLPISSTYDINNLGFLLMIPSWTSTA